MPFSNPLFLNRQVSPQSTRPLQVGTGRAIAHHGEILQGVFLDDAGRLHRGLLTLPFPRLESIVTFWPDDGDNIRTRPAGRTKAAQAAKLTLRELGLPHVGGDLTIETAIPVGCGYGSSTADVVAAIRATAAAVGIELRRTVISRLAVAAETASDAIVFGEQAVLFAHREGQVIEYLPGEYPPLHVVGFASRDDAPVDTLAYAPARYDSMEIETFRVLRGLGRRAIREQDARLLGRVATASARINQRHLPKARFDECLRLAEKVGACGVQVAHSGNRMGILIDANELDAASRTMATITAAREIGFDDICRFALNIDALPL